MAEPDTIRCAVCGWEASVDDLQKIPEKCSGCGANLTMPQGNAESGKAAETSAPHLEGKKVLLVDDDGDFLQLMKLRLRITGCTLFAAMDGLMATVLVRKEKPDLVFLDISLPAGDGFVLLDRWAKMPLRFPIIVMTSRDPSGVRERVLQAGAQAFLPKTSSVTEIFATIRQVLGCS